MPENHNLFSNQAMDLNSSAILSEQIIMLNQLLNSIPDIIFFKDLKGVYLGCNNAFARFVGMAPSEIISRTDFDLFDKDIAAEFVRNDQLTLSSGQSRHNREWINYPDGSCVFVDTLKAPLWGKDNSVIGVLGISRDITNQNLIEEKLKSSVDNFRTFFESIDDLIFIANQQGEIFYVNSAVIRKLGYSEEELKGMHVLDVHPVNLRQEANTIFSEMFAGSRDSCPLPLARKDGNLVPVETRVWFGKWDNQDCMFGMCKDLSKEQELLQKFNKIFESNPAPMAISSIPEGVFTDVNSAFINSIGYSRPEVIGRSSTDLKLFIEPEIHHEVQEELSHKGHINPSRTESQKKVRRNPPWSILWRNH